MHEPPVTKQPPKPASLTALIILTGLTLLLWDSPYVSWLLFPVKTFVTALHEFSHAIICLGTGGSVEGMTIVEDYHGHGGVTMCRGGNPLLYTPAGYLGT